MKSPIILAKMKIFTLRKYKFLKIKGIMEIGVLKMRFCSKKIQMLDLVSSIIPPIIRMRCHKKTKKLKSNI